VARILIVHPGPDFSVADVYRGWQKALTKLGHTVMTYNTNDRLTFYGHLRIADAGQPACEHGNLPTHKALDNDGIIQLGMDGLYADLNKFWPDVVLFVSAFYMSPAMLQFIRTRRHKIVMLHTESPYEDSAQMERGQFADLNLLNDPVNLEAWRELEVPAAYMPHAYDPDVHYPNWRPDRYESDFTFVGTIFKSRAEFFSKMDFTGVDVALGGAGWDLAMAQYPELVTTVMDREAGHRLVDYVGHGLDCCVTNDETARVYRSARCGINFYRRESEDAHTGEGWAMGPREVEMAACGLFFLRDPRPESDEVFGAESGTILLPAFHSPGEASELLRWWLDHPNMREMRTQQAYERIAARTFDNNARAALNLMEEAGIL
jgi:spore maturation protein CgeB